MDLKPAIYIDSFTMKIHLNAAFKPVKSNSPLPLNKLVTYPAINNISIFFYMFMCIELYCQGSSGIGDIGDIGTLCYFFGKILESHSTSLYPGV